MDTMFQNNLGKDHLLFCEAVGGALYRKQSLPLETLNVEKFLELAPKADDVWLWFCTYFNQGKIKFIPTYKNKKLQYIIPDSQNTALWIDNTIGKRTDIYVENCYKYFLEKYDFDIIKDYSR